MTSQKRIDANRRNALLSTGPRTPEGKARSAWNAFRHGGRARCLVAATLDRDDFRRRRRSWLRDLRPVGLMETHLAEDAFLLRWELELVARMEARLIDRDQAEAMEAVAGGKVVAPPGQDEGVAYSIALGTVMGRSFAGPSSPYENLSRRERRLDRAFREAVSELRRLQQARKAMEAADRQGLPRAQKSARTNPTGIAAAQVAQTLVEAGASVPFRPASEAPPTPQSEANRRGILAGAGSPLRAQKSARTNPIGQEALRAMDPPANTGGNEARRPAIDAAGPLQSEANGWGSPAAGRGAPKPIEEVARPSRP